MVCAKQINAFPGKEISHATYFVYTLP